MMMILHLILQSTIDTAYWLIPTSIKFNVFDRMAQCTPTSIADRNGTINLDYWLSVHKFKCITSMFAQLVLTHRTNKQQ